MSENKYSLGVVSVSFRENTPSEILEAARAAGLSCIEWGSDVHAPCDAVEKLYEIAELQKKYGIICSSYGTYFRLGVTPAEELEKYIRAAKILGTDILRLWCGSKSGTAMTEAERGEFLSVCKNAARIAKRYGVTLCMECHRNTFTENPDDAVWLMESVNSPHFRMYWQPFQWQSVEKNLENARKIAPYTVHIHVFEWRENVKLSLSEGVAEWQGYLEAFSAPRTLLLEFMPNGKIEELIAEASALKSIVGEQV